MSVGDPGRNDRGPTIDPPAPALGTDHRHDLVPRGGVDWRPAWLARKTSAPTWFVDDGTDVTERLALVAPPTLLIFGDSDPISPIAIGEFLLNRLPSAQLKVVPGGTHDLIEERPDVVAEWIDAHLRL